MSRLENQLSRYGAVTRVLPATTGKVFFVIHGDNANTLDMLEEFPPDRDGVPRVYATISGAATDDLAIQAALDATVAGRDDYVIVMPGNGNDYDLGAALTMSKNGVHLVTLEALSTSLNNEVRVGASRQVVLEQTASADTVQISGQNCEFAGFYIKPKANKTTINVASAAHSYNIHHNLIYVVVSTTMAEYVIDVVGNAIYGNISNNFFTSQSGTCAAVIFVNTSCTGSMVTRNYLICGDSATWTIGIYNGGYKGVTQYNTVAAITGAGADGTVTTCFQTAGGVCNDNRANAANTADFTCDGTYDELANYSHAINHYS